MTGTAMTAFAPALLRTPPMSTLALLSYRGVARPNRPFTTGAAGWGALERVAHHGELDVDDAFPLFVDPTKSTSGIAAWSLGLDCFLTRNLKPATTCSHATFNGSAAAGADREGEKTLFTRAQISF